jgi:hypothetical protein
MNKYRTHTIRLYRLHTALNALYMTPKLSSDSCVRLEAAEEMLNDYRNAEAQGRTPPGDIRSRIIREIHSALPPEQLAAIIAKLPTKLRRIVTESLAESPVCRVIRVRSNKPRKL